MATSLNDWILNCSDTELAAFIRDCPRLQQHPGISLLSNQYLAKAYNSASVGDTEEAVEVAHRSGIRVPRFIRSVQCEDTVFTIMERIKGETLEDAWPSLGWLASFRLALQLRRFIAKMRSITSKTAGSLATGECRSFWLDDHFGLPARAKAKDISAFLAFWVGFISIRKELKRGAHEHSSLREPSILQKGELVLTHHDLAPRNMVVDPSGEIWLLDWDFAGFYPMYFEYASMNNFTPPGTWGVLSRIRWYLFTWMAAGRSDKESQLLQMVRSKFLRFGAGRRSNIKAQATQSRRRKVSHSSESSDS